MRLVCAYTRASNATVRAKLSVNLECDCGRKSAFLVPPKELETQPAGTCLVKPADMVVQMVECEEYFMLQVLCNTGTCQRDSASVIYCGGSMVVARMICTVRWQACSGPLPAAAGGARWQLEGAAGTPCCAVFTLRHAPQEAANFVNDVWNPEYGHPLFWSPAHLATPYVSPPLRSTAAFKEWVAQMMVPIARRTLRYFEHDTF